jgi:hypothetical protein
MTQANRALSEAVPAPRILQQHAVSGVMGPGCSTVIGAFNSLFWRLTMGKQARVNAARKAAGLPVDDNGYHEKRRIVIRPSRRGKSMLPALFAAAIAKAGGK